MTTATLPTTHVLDIPFHRPSIGREEIEAVVDTLQSGWLTTGPKTRAFESAFAEYVGAKHAVALNSCTAALHLSLLAEGIGPGDEVVTTPMTFAATANVIEHVGARPRFCDVDSQTLNMDPVALERVITPRTRAIIPVHFAGNPCGMDAINRIALAHGLVVIEDAAHAVESVYRGQKIGSISRSTCFSFYATKNLTTGEGGMVTTDDDALADRLRTLSLHGISVDAWQRSGNRRYKHWDIVDAGYKYNMCDIQAAIGLQQLNKLERFLEQRQFLTELYDSLLRDVPGIITLKRNEDCRSAFHLYVIRIATEQLTMSRDRFLELLQDQGIGVGIHFRAVHLHPYYREKYDYQAGSFAVAEYAGDRVVSLPLYPELSPRKVEHVCAVVREILAKSA